jgi:predicted ATPase/class 3 adenylate cyclase
VTFLFSDMEGSTRLVQDLGPAVFTRILEQHNEMLRTAFGRHGGVERGTQGDSFLVMFHDAPGAVAAAVEAQRALTAADWPADRGVRVRMGLHTGVGALGGDDYVGVDVNRAARVAGLAHGGQVLLSDATRALVEDSLPAGVGLRALGEHRLRDLTRTERIHQLTIEGLPSSFPPLRSPATRIGNLPARQSSFIGREAELTALAGLLDAERLITLTGPGGTGKTRLAVELARRVADRFADGAWLVRLDAVRDPSLVPAALAATLGLVESPGLAPMERLVAFLADRELLLVLDNMEQVLEAAPRVGELLDGSPRLRVVATSRAPLRLSAEQEFPVGPLGFARGADEPALVAETESARLFVERARRARPSFEPDTSELASIGHVCRLLDGLPLGIELAASRIGLLPVAALVERLTGRLDLPGPGRRDLPARQQTLQGAIAWSYDLLDPPARALLARLSVFAGGFRLVEGEAVADGPAQPGADFLDALSTLVDHSLVQPMPGPDVPRFRLLETIRLFAGERLAGLDEVAVVRRRHAEAYLALAEAAAAVMPGRHQVRWLDRLDVEIGNLRAAVRWAIDAGDAEIAHRLVAASWRFWQFRGHIDEGRRQLAEVLAMPGADAATPWRMRALDAAGGLAWWSGDIPGADRQYAAMSDMARELDDVRGLADARFNLLHTRFLTASHDELDAMRSAAIAGYEEVGDAQAVARTRWTAGYALMREGRLEEAWELVRTGYRSFVELEDDFYIPLAASALAAFSLQAGDIGGAMRALVQALVAQHAMGDIASVTLAFRAAAIGWQLLGEPSAAVTVFGAFEGHCRRHGVKPPLNPEAWMGIDPDIDKAIAAIPPGATPDDAERGARMTTDEAVEYVTEFAASRLG